MTPKVSERGRLWRWTALACALALLNVSLTFRNVWPTPGVEWTGDLSIELAVFVLGLSLAMPRFGAPPRWLITWLAGVWLLLAIGRYADVTAPAVYGREINLYWDVRHMGAVAAMLATAVSPWIVAAVVVAVLLVSHVAHRFLRWAIGCVAEAMSHPCERRVVGAIAAAVSLLFVGQHISGAPSVLRFSTPVTESYARQARLFTTDLASETIIPAAQRLDSDLSGVAGADVFIVFVESYGAVSYDNATFATRLAPGRASLAADIDATRRGVVSAFVESPTFGGSSWLAHASLLTGVEVRNEDTNVRLMAQARDTLVTTFARRGYRTVAAMPGNSHPWPEGAFYRFDQIYDRARLDYRGPRFGWWFVPDQFTLARLDALEIAPRARKPVFVVMPTISTHAPFGPTAPYQPDWARLLTAQPYADADVAEALAHEPDLLNMGPSYVNAIAYTYASIGGYLRMRADRDVVMIVIGDHQPAAAVSGQGASWDVPLHVIASRPQLLERLEAHGFTRGLTPARAHLGPMNRLLPVFLDAFAAGPEAAGLQAE
ncbi:MAG TPA: sulfatase-like hydrolase/transferase [Vicinamibacterales bacterium]